MRSGLEDRDPRIAAARAALTEAERAFLKTVRAVQAECPHTVVVGRDWSSGDYLRRDGVMICLACGLEEHRAYGHVSDGFRYAGPVTGPSEHPELGQYGGGYFEKSHVVAAQGDIWSYRP